VNLGSVAGRGELDADPEKGFQKERKEWVWGVGGGCFKKKKNLM